MGGGKTIFILPVGEHVCTNTANPSKVFSGVSARVVTKGRREFDALDFANNVRWLQAFERGMRRTVDVLLPPKTASLPTPPTRVHHERCCLVCLLVCFLYMFETLGG